MRLALYRISPGRWGGAGAGEGRRGYPEGRRTRRATFVARGQISNARRPICETVTRSGSCDLLLELGRRRALSIGGVQMVIKGKGRTSVCRSNLKGS